MDTVSSFTAIASAYQPQPNELQNRIILVTGAGAGIGRDAAINFAKFGATVILMGRTVRKLEAVYDDIVAAGYPEPGICPVDLNGVTEQELETIAEQLLEQYSRLDGLLHNASELGQRTPIANANVDTWKKVMHTNVNAVFMLTKSLLPLLEKSHDSRIIFTSSSVGRVGRAHWGAYAVSKFATEGLMQVLADELTGIMPIRINAINPGATRTAMRAKAYPAENPNQLKTAEQIMPAYLYLIGSASNACHGQTIDAQPK